jgi:hypothetical protein
MVKRLTPERQRDRVLNDDEARAAWEALDDEDAVIASVFRTQGRHRRFAAGVSEPKKDQRTSRNAQKAIDRIVERSGVAFRGHDLRRTAASR